MPYRRLPNTDAARIRAMRIALKKGKELPPYKVAFSAKTIVNLQRFLPLFEHSIQLQRQAVIAQYKKSKDYNELEKKAKIYLTHFIRVMNMAVYRGDMPAETRAYYGLPTNESTVPSLTSDGELISWGKRIIEGEEHRIRKGGSPITNPTIAVVKVRFENFLNEWNGHKLLIKKTLDYTEKVNMMRREADEIILQLWNEIETRHSTLPENIRKTESEDYGLVYIYRKNELDKADKPEAQGALLN
ncbi:MAG: hypothetical protein IQL11_01170 [Bacteroidales bacterium]|nr:hypothetical protein [Bacteroidales bacterium]